MDAAEAVLIFPDKSSKPYLSAINCQLRALNFLNEFQQLMEKEELTPEEKQKEENLQVLIQQAHEVTKKVRTESCQFYVEDPLYSGARFFPEIPH